MAQVRTRKRGKFNVELGVRNCDANLTPHFKLLIAFKVAAYNDFLHGNIGITSEKITLKDFMSAWLENVVSTNVKPTSKQKYRSHFKNQIAPHLGEVKVQDLTPAMLDEWMRKLLQSGLAKNTLTAMHSLLHNALNYAVYPAQLISSNPAAYIKVPKNAPQNIIERHIISPEQFAALLEKNPFGTPFYMPLLILYHTGARLGEVLGLSWSDVDFDAKRITVRRQMTYRNRLG